MVRCRERILVFILLSILLLGCNNHSIETANKQLFDLNWKFNPGDNYLASKIEFEDESWRSVDLPHDWAKDNDLPILKAEENPETVITEIGWYRKQFQIPENWSNKEILIDFEGISNEHQIYINGVLIDYSKGKDNSVQIPLNEYLNYSGNNVIAIQLTNHKDSGTLWGTNVGIYKHVWLIIRDS